jgi:hypothetical protein
MENIETKIILDYNNDSKVIRKFLYFLLICMTCYLHIVISKGNIYIPIQTQSPYF